MRWAVAESEDGGVRLCPLGRDGSPAGEVVRADDLATAVRSRPEVTRWVWRSTAAYHPRLLAAGVRVDRCYDVEAAEGYVDEAARAGEEGRLVRAWPGRGTTRRSGRPATRPAASGPIRLRAGSRRARMKPCC
jgi:DNA polymerase-1